MYADVLCVQDSNVFDLFYKILWKCLPRYYKKSIQAEFIESNLSIYSLYYAEACNGFAGPISASLRQQTQLLSKKSHSGGEPLAPKCPIWPARGLNPRFPAPETNALPLDQQQNLLHVKINRLKQNC